MPFVGAVWAAVAGATVAVPVSVAARWAILQVPGAAAARARADQAVFVVWVGLPSLLTGIVATELVNPRWLPLTVGVTVAGIGAGAGWRVLMPALTPDRETFAALTLPRLALVVVTAAPGLLAWYGWPGCAAAAIVATLTARAMRAAAVRLLIPRPGCPPTDAKRATPLIRRTVLTMRSLPSLLSRPEKVVVLHSLWTSPVLLIPVRFVALRLGLSPSAAQAVTMAAAVIGCGWLTIDAAIITRALRRRQQRLRAGRQT